MIGGTESFAKATHLKGGAGTTPDSRVVDLKRPATGRDVFTTPSMLTIVEALRSSIADASNVTVVCGVHGSGKSSLIEVLTTQLPSGWDICRIQARHTIGEKHILEQLNRRFLQQEDLDAAGLAVRLAQADSRRPVIIVDDADRLTTFALDTLLQLKQAVEKQQGRVGIVMFARPTIRQVLAGPSLQRYDAQLRTIDLPPLTAAEVKAYVDHWQDVRGRRDSLPLSAAQLQALHKRSAGLPARLNDLLEQLDDRHEQENTLPTRAANLPVVSGLMVMAVVIGIAMTVIFWSLHNDKGDAGSTAFELAQADKSASDVTGAELDGPATTEDTAAVTTKAPEQGDAMPATAKHQAERQAAPRSDAKPPENNPPENNPPEHKPDRTTPAAPSAAVEPVSSTSTTTVSAMPPPQPRTAAVAQAEDTVAQDTAAIPSAAASADGAGRDDGQAWLRAQDGEHFTVQLAASLDSDAIEKFIASQPDLPGLHYVHIKQRKRDWYISLYGSFNNLALARSAVDRLPASMRKNSPWIRRIAKLQDLMPVTGTASDTGDTDGSDVTTQSAAATTTPMATDGPAAAPTTAAEATDSATKQAPVDEPAQDSATASPQSVGDSGGDLSTPPVLH